MIFVETSPFAKRRDKYLDDDEFSHLQSWLAFAPEAGAVIKGSGGARKLRWPGQNKGKRGGLRVIYVHIPNRHRIYLLTIYGKNEVTDLTRDQLRTIRTIIRSIRHELKAKHR